jgi:hypothetical protein
MEIFHSIKINEINGKVWDTVSSFRNAEKYYPIISKSSVEGEGVGAKRICDVSIGKQEFQIQESILSLDSVNQLLVVSLDDGPIQMRGIKTKFSVKDLGDNKAELFISTDVSNPDAGVMMKSIFEMIGDGLKKFHEL